MVGLGLGRWDGAAPKVDDPRPRLHQATVAGTRRASTPVDVLPVGDEDRIEAPDSADGIERDKKTRAVEPGHRVRPVGCDRVAAVGSQPGQPRELTPSRVRRAIAVPDDRGDGRDIGSGGCDQSIQHAGVRDQGVVVQEEDVGRAVLRGPTNRRVVSTGNDSVLRKPEGLNRWPKLCRQSGSFRLVRSVVDDDHRDRPASEPGQALNASTCFLVAVPGEHTDDHSGSRGIALGRSLVGGRAGASGHGRRIDANGSCGAPRSCSGGLHGRIMTT